MIFLLKRFFLHFRSSRLCFQFKQYFIAASLNGVTDGQCIGAFFIHLTKLVVYATIILHRDFSSLEINL